MLAAETLPVGPAKRTPHPPPPLAPPELLDQRGIRPPQPLADRDLGPPPEVTRGARGVEAAVLQLPGSQIGELRLDPNPGGVLQPLPDTPHVGLDAGGDVVGPAVPGGGEQRPHDVPDIDVVPRGRLVPVERGRLAD